MRSKVIFILIILILIIGCASTNKKYQAFFDSDYNVLDRGELDVKVTTQACSHRYKDAFSAAKKNGKFHLRSIVGSKNHRIKFEEVSSYVFKGKICVEMSASSFPP